MNLDGPFYDDLHVGMTIPPLPPVTLTEADNVIYRAITGETVPAAERVAVSALAGALMGGPLGVLGTLVAILAEEIWDAGPDPAGPQWRDPDSGAKNQAAAAAAWGTPSGSG